MMVQLAKAAGAGKVALIGTRDGRIELGRKLGADFVVNVADSASPNYVADLEGFVRDNNGGERADRAVTSTSSLSAIELALKCTGPASTIVIFGLPGDSDVHKLPAADCMFMDKTIRYSWLAPTSWPDAVQAIAEGKVTLEGIQSHRFPLDDTAEAIRKLRDREDNTIKTLIQVAEA
jgi:threonine dehydrogenase-like Zn-dependent dehydrogenase